MQLGTGERSELFASRRRACQTSHEPRKARTSESNVCTYAARTHRGRPARRHRGAAPPAQRRRLRDSSRGLAGGRVPRRSSARLSTWRSSTSTTRATPPAARKGWTCSSACSALDATLPVVVMTAWGSVELAVEAMRRGARDFVQKPWDNARLLAILRTQIELGRALRKGSALEAENRLAPRRRARARASSPTRRRCARCCELIERVGPSDANVLITGENGTGKDVVARTLHARRPRAPQAAGHGQRRRPRRRRLRERAVRPRQGRVHRRQEPTASAASSWPTAARSSSTRSRTCRISQQAKLLRVLETGEFERVGSSQHAPRGRAHPLRHERRPRRRSRRRAASARTCSSG